MNLCLLRSSRVATIAPTLLLRVAFKSSAATTASLTDATTSNAQSAPAPPIPTLRHVPKLPLVGSLWYAHSKIPRMDQSKIFDFWPEMRRQFGEFYSLGIPGLGVGLSGTVYVIQDATEMAKIVRQEGSFPAGAAEFAWPVAHYSREHKQSVGGLLSRGPAWKRVRSFIQTDLLHPQSAAQYTPAILQAAASSSRGAPAYADNQLNEYLNIASFEMFSNVMLGQLPRIADPSHETDAVDVQFCESVATALRLNGGLMHSGWDAVLTTKLGMKTATYKHFEREWERAMSIARGKVDDLYERRLLNQLTAAEVNCYANHAFDRHAAAETDESLDASNRLTLDEVKTVAGGLLSAGVDTTGGLLSWKLLHIALSPSTQDRIHAELTASMKNHGVTHLIPECVSPKEAPYLHAALRESHRLANTSITIPMKLMPAEIQVHGVTLPAGSVILFDSYSTGVRTDVAGDEPLEFDPSRFLPESVAARKRTAAAVMDHPFFAAPFSQGARKCPGSRVASMEAVAVMGQLILDWKIAVPGVQHWTEVPYDLRTVVSAQLPRMEFTPRSNRAAI